MPITSHPLVRYFALDNCFSNYYRKYYIEDLIQACNEALYEYTGESRYSNPLSPGISRRQIFEDIKFMESSSSWENVKIENI